jgi:hypothetical protein
MVLHSPSDAQFFASVFAAQIVFFVSPETLLGVLL